MSKLEPTLFNHIVDFLIDHVGETERQRKALITPTFRSYEGLYSQIDWSGANREFTVHLVELFNKHGEVESGKQALILLLQGLRPQVGVDDQRAIDLFCQLLEKNRMSPAINGLLYCSAMPTPTTSNQRSKWFSRTIISLLLIAITALTIIWLKPFSTEPTSATLSLAGELVEPTITSKPPITDTLTEQPKQTPTVLPPNATATIIPTSTSSPLPNVTSNETPPDSMIQGIWDFDISSYKEVRSDGVLRDSTDKAKYAIELTMTDVLVTGKILGASGVCDEASILGTRAEHKVEFIMTYTGRCCGGEKFSFMADYDPIVNTLNGTMEPVDIPKLSCRLWYANFDALLRDPFPSLSEYRIEKKASIAPSNFKSGIWDIDITATEKLESNAMLQNISEFREYVMRLELKDSVLTGDLIGATGGLCSQADIEGFIDGETIRFILTHTGSCCTNGRTLFSGTIESDGTIFTGLMEPADIPSANCDLWFANIVGTKR